MTCAMLLETGATDDVCIDGTAAALLHDVGCALLPEEIRDLPGIAQVDPDRDATPAPCRDLFGGVFHRTRSAVVRLRAAP